MGQKQVTTEEAKKIGAILGILFDTFDIEQFRMGMEVEFEHGTVNPDTNVTNDDPMMTGRIALAHLREIPDYYTRLAAMEKEGDTYWEKNKKNITAEETEAQ